MSGCLDNVQCNCGFDWGEKRNAIASVVSSILFFSGWWIIIDIAVMYPSEKEFLHAYYSIGVVSTLSMAMINAISNSHVRGDSMNSDGVLGVRGARLWLLFGFLVGFGALIASAWCMFDHYVVNNPDRPQWPGVGLFLQNALIFFASLIYKFGRTEDLWG